MEKLYNVSEVAEMLGVSASFIYKKVENGELEYAKLGSALRFRDDHIRGLSAREKHRREKRNV
jgi:excisionase family DNA binding protein